MRRKLLCASLVLTALAGGLIPAAALEADAPERVLKVLRDYVAQNPGHQLVGVGSWIKGGYWPGISDHDIRLLVPAGTGDDAARGAWRSARQDIIRRLTLEFQKDGVTTVEQVLKKTNLYSPQQLMGGARDLDDATRIFRGIGQVPNLGFPYAVNPSTNPKYFEGLYGEGALANIQFKELGEGRLIYSSGNRVFTGRLDLTHLAEGQGRFTVGGTANTAYQWASHAIDALHEKDPRAVLKYLERLDLDLVKGRDLARLAGDSPVQAQLRNLAARLRANPQGAMNLFGDDIASVLRKAQMEASLMKRLGGGNVVGQVMARALLEGRDGAGRLWKALSDAAEKVPAGALIDGVFTAWMAHGVLMSAADKDVMGAYTGAFGMIAGLGPGLLAEIVAGTLEAARYGGYDLVANTQDAADLLAGIYTGVGRAGVDDRAYTIDQLVSNFWLEEQVRCLVYARCVAAADRGFGNVTGRHDMGSAEAIFEKCFPVILRAWQGKRDMMAMEYAQQCDEMAQDLLLIRYSPIPAELKDGRAEVTLWSTTASNRQGERLARLHTILRLLLGPQARVYANVYNTWTPAGKDTGKSDGSMAYTLTEPGKHVIKLSQTVSVGAANVALKSPLVREVTRETAVEITVQEAGGGAGKPPGPFVAVSTVPINAVVYREGKRLCFRLVGQISADVPLEGGKGLGNSADVSQYANDEDPRYLGIAYCKAPAGKTANVSVTVTPSGGGNYNAGKDQYFFSVKSATLALVDPSAGFPASLTDSVVTFTPRDRYDTAYVQLIVEIKAVHVWDDGHQSEMGGTANAPIRLRLLSVGGK